MAVPTVGALPKCWVPNLVAPLNRGWRSSIAPGHGLQYNSSPRRGGLRLAGGGEGCSLGQGDVGRGFFFQLPQAQMAAPAPCKRKQPGVTAWPSPQR